MAEVIGASDRAALAAVEDLPVLKVADLGADPHGMFRRYRAAYPFVGHEMGGYLVLRHAYVERLGNDPRTAASETAHPEMYGVTEGALFDLFKQGMLTANGAVHRRRRSPFSRSFAVRTMADLRPQIRRSSEDLIESWYADGQVEFVGQLASQVPARVISDLLGLPRADIPSFTKLVYLVTKFLSASILPDEIPKSEAACEQLRGYVEKTFEDRRRAPRDDFLSDFLVKADEAGELSSRNHIPDPAVDRRRHRHNSRGHRDATGASAPAQGAMGRGVSRSFAHSGCGC